MIIKKRVLLLLLGLVLLCAAIAGVYYAAAAAERRRAPLVDAAESAPSFIGVAQETYPVTVDGETLTQRSELTTILFMGIDDFGPAAPSGSYNNDGQADFLALIILDTQAKTYQILHLNRDTMTEITVLGLNSVPVDTVTAQLAIAHAYGSGMEDSCENTRKAVSTLLYGVRIDRYLSMTMSGVGVVNDLVGGVPVTVLDDFNDDSFRKGESVTLRGDQALRYVRGRTEAGDGTNLSRMARQRQYLGALIEQLAIAAEESGDIGMRIYEAAADYLVTDMDAGELSELAQTAAAYDFLGTQALPGSTAVGKHDYIEFTVDTAALPALVKRLLLA